MLFQTSRDHGTQTETDNYVDFVNIPSYPIQRKPAIAATLKSLMANKLHSDVTFCINDEYVAAHRIILAASSKVFETMLYDYNKAHGHIEHITDIPMDIFRQVLAHIYTDQIQINHDNAVEIMYVAHKYNLAFLQDICEQFIYHHKTYRNVLGYINQLFPFNAFETLKSKLFKYVCDNFYAHFANVNCFAPIDSIDLVKCLLEKLVALEHKDDCGRFEYDLFNMLLQWAKNKTKEQSSTDVQWLYVRQCLEGTEQLINFENMNAELLNKCVAANPGFFTKDEICAFFTRENAQTQLPYQRNNDIEVQGQGEGFIIFKANPNMLNKQFQALLPAGKFLENEQ